MPTSQNIHAETAGARALRDFREAVHSLRFFAWLLFCEAAGLAPSIALSQDHSVGAQVLIGVSIFAAAAFFACASVFVPLWVTAPIRQRDEARETVRNLRGEGASIPYSEAKALAESALAKGEAFLATLENSTDPDVTSTVYAELNPWFTETFYDLRRYSETWAQPFASSGGTGFSDISPHHRERLISNLRVKTERIRSMLQGAEDLIAEANE